MRIFICTAFILNTLFATSITCKGKIKEPTLYKFEQKAGSSLLVNQGELDENLIYGDIDPANSSVSYYDNRSAICGGSFDYNKIIVAYCDWNFDYCYDVNLGSRGFKTIEKKEGNYVNKIIFSGVYPCLPYNVSKVTVGFYDYDNKDIGLANFSLTNIEEEIIEQLTKKEAKAQREYCPNLLKYVDEWEIKLNEQNEALNKDIENINTFNQNTLKSTLQDINNSLKSVNNDNSNNPDYNNIANTLNINPNISLEINTFKSDIESSLINSFSSYSNVFGFGSYGKAPNAINFTMLGKTYSAFDIRKYDEHLPLIRNSFLAFAYLWGFVLTLRTLS